MNVLSRLFGSTSTSAPASADASVVDAAEAKRRQDAGAALIDVRELNEWQSGHAPGARHIPLGQLANRLSQVPRDRDVLLVCQSGNRSGAARRLLRSNGIERAINVRGGMSAWGRAGLPVTR